MWTEMSLNHDMWVNSLEMTSADMTLPRQKELKALGFVPFGHEVRQDSGSLSMEPSERTAPSLWVFVARVSSPDLTCPRSHSSVRHAFGTLS